MKCYRKLYYYKEVVLRYNMKNSNNTTEPQDCPVLYKIQDRLLAIGFEDDENTSKNPELQKSIQNEISQHVMKCNHSKCQISYNARVEVGIQTKDGVYLK